MNRFEDICVGIFVLSVSFSIVALTIVGCIELLYK